MCVCVCVLHTKYFGLLFLCDSQLFRTLSRLFKLNLVAILKVIWRCWMNICCNFCILSGIKHNTSWSWQCRYLNVLDLGNSHFPYITVKSGKVKRSNFWNSPENCNGLDTKASQVPLMLKDQPKDHPEMTGYPEGTFTIGGSCTAVAVFIIDIFTTYQSSQGIS